MQGHTPFGRLVRHCAVRIPCARQRVWVRDRRENTGKAFMYVMTIKVDDPTHFRVVRKLDGTSGGIMMRRLAPDHQSYVSTGLDENGNIQYKRTYKKVDHFSLTTATAD